MKYLNIIFPLSCLLLCGCPVPLEDTNTQREVSREELIGRWVLDSHARKMISEESDIRQLDEFYIEFKPDGECVFYSVYSKGFDLVVLQSSGKWTLEHDTKGNSNRLKKNAILLDMDSNEFYSNAYLNLTERDGTLYLWSFHADPDSGDIIEYEKVANQGMDPTR